jgi:MYXO-CTERM domain-containing protein
MKQLLLSITAVAAALAVAGGASAAVNVSQTQILTEDGQDMDFLFAGLPEPDDGSAGTITIASGGSAITEGLDLSGAFTDEDEYFEVFFDGALQGSYSADGPSSNGSTPIPGAVDNSVNFNDAVFTLALPVDAATLAGLLADGNLTVGVYFGDDVDHAWNSGTRSHRDEVVVSVEYTAVDNGVIPEPSTVTVWAALSGFGLLVARRRRKE